MNPSGEIWIVEDDRALRTVLLRALAQAGLPARACASLGEAQSGLAGSTPAVLLTDLRLPDGEGLALAPLLAERGVPLLVMSAYTDIANTAAAYRAGAVDYLAKPFDLDQAIAALRRALAGHEGTVTNPGSTSTAGTPLLGQGRAMREVFRLIGRVAASELTVLITGETGSGKELVARALHDESARRLRPFVALNTAAIPADLLESELFGHEAGAFTGALRRNPGRFEQAAGGTLFLDEIGDMPLGLQTRLLRVLSGGEYYRVGGRELLRADVRIIAATHQDLAAKVAAGQFRSDLLHRLDVVRIELPALAARREDIPLLAGHFLARAAGELGVPPKRFAAETLRALAQMAFPGNVRQLENLCRRLAVIAPGREIQPQDLGSGHGSATDVPWTQVLAEWAAAQLAAGTPGLHAQARALLDRTLLETALRQQGGHRQHAAAALGLGRNTLTRKLGAGRKRRRPPPAEPPPPEPRAPP